MKNYILRSLIASASSFIIVLIAAITMNINAFMSIHKFVLAGLAALVVSVPSGLLASMVFRKNHYFMILTAQAFSFIMLAIIFSY